MTTATMQNYKSVTWQNIKKIADEMNVPFYKQTERYIDNGLGLAQSHMDDTKIIIRGYQRAHSNNEWTNNLVGRLSHENFMLKLELWAIKNNVKFEYVEAGQWKDAYFRIVVA